MKSKYIFTGILIFQAMNLAWAVSTNQSLWLTIFTAFVLGWVALYTLLKWVDNK